MKKHLLTLFFTLLIIGLNAQTLYFKCTTATSGQYNWNTASNWYTDPLCTVSAGGTPISTNDVIIGNAAFTANSQVINIDASSQACKGFTISYAGTYTNVAVVSVLGNVLNVFGHFNLTPFDNTKLSIANWKGDLTLNPVTTGTINVLTGGKRLVLNSINIPGNTIEYTVNFNDSLFLDRWFHTPAYSGYITIGTGYTTTNSVKVNFNDLVKLGHYYVVQQYGGNYHSSVEIISGNVSFNNGVFSTFPSSLYPFTFFDATYGTGGIIARNSALVNISPQTLTSGSYPIARNKTLLGYLQANGTSALNTTTINAINQTIQIDGPFTGNFSNINFTNSIVNANLRGNVYPFNSWGVNSNSLLSMVGSTLNLMPQGKTVNVGTFSQTNGHVYNIINVFDDLSITRINAGSFSANQFNVVTPNKTIFLSSWLFNAV